MRAPADLDRDPNHGSSSAVISPGAEVYLLDRTLLLLRHTAITHLAEAGCHRHGNVELTSSARA
jgi:hypothetical protein